MSPQQIPHCEFSMSHGVTVWTKSTKELELVTRARLAPMGSALVALPRSPETEVETLVWSFVSGSFTLMTPSQPMSCKCLLGPWHGKRYSYGPMWRSFLQGIGHVKGSSLRGILYDVHSKYFKILKRNFVVTSVQLHMPHFSGCELQLLRHWELPRFFVLRTRRLVLHFNSKLGLFPLPKRICANFSRRLFGM